MRSPSDNPLGWPLYPDEPPPDGATPRAAAGGETVLMFGTYGDWINHLGTELELAERHARQGDRVEWILCDAAFDACEPNPDHDGPQCLRCQGRLRTGLARLSCPVSVHRLSRLLTDADRAQIAGLTNRGCTVEDLRAMRVGTFDIGWAALSSAIWLHKDPAVDPTSDEVLRFMRAGLTAYLAARRHLASHRVDRVYVFNGRMAPMRGALRAAQELGVHCVVHERGRDHRHFALFDNCMPHDIAPMIARVHQAWERSPLDGPAKARVAAEWFEARAGGHGGAWISFVAGQRRGQLPADWDPDRHNVTLFTSSEYERASISDECATSPFGTPTEAVVVVAEELSRLGEVHLTIRVHPNPDGADSSSVQRILGLDLPGVTVVGPKDPVSTYALIDASDMVLSCGSTVGVEAVHRGRPSILVGAGLFSGLGVAHEPDSMGELVELIRNPRPLPGGRELALRYGYYQATLGTAYEHFEPDGLFDGTWRGRELRPSRLRRMHYRLARTCRKLLGVPAG